MSETTLLPLSIEQQELVYQDRNQKIYKIIARFDGFSKEYYVSDHGQRAAVVAVRNGEVLLVRQYRLLINGLSYEIPGSRVDENETPEAAAIRECLEETGVQCLNLKPLISYHPSLNIWKKYTYIFYSEELKEIEKDNSERRVWIPLERCINMVFAQQIVDSLSIVALLAYHTLRTGQTSPSKLSQPMSSAIFLDRDGVLIEDVHLLTCPGDIRVLEGVPQALRSLKEVGFQLIIISNQTVVARGLISEQEVYVINAEMERILEQAGGPRLDGFYFCPHHPNATLPTYRITCDCRKPRPGLLLRAAREHNLNLGASFVVGDRITDIIAGARAGCRTVLVQTGKHEAPPIETVEPLDESVQPDHVCADLRAAAEWILRTR